MDVLIIAPNSRQGEWCRMYRGCELGFHPMLDRVSVAAAFPTAAIALEGGRYDLVVIDDYLRWGQGVSEIWHRLEVGRLTGRIVKRVWA